MNPLVSIIIPVFNAELYLAETIQSAIDQSWANKEIIIVDDGSTDQSFKIALQFQREGVKVFSKDNGGASSARNYGLARSNGEYIQFLDADDLLSSHKIERQIASLKNHKNFVSICSTVHFKNGENAYSLKPDRYNQDFLFSTTDTYNFLLNLYGKNGSAGMITIHSWLTPKKIIDEIGLWNELLTVDDDGEYFCRVVLNTEGIIYTDDVFCYYRKYENGISLSTQFSEKALASTYQSALIKKKLLLEVDNSFSTMAVIYRLFINIAIRSFPKHYSTYKISMNELPKIKYPYKLEVGGRKITNNLARILGWQTIRLAQYLWNKL